MKYKSFKWLVLLVIILSNISLAQAKETAPRGVIRPQNHDNDCTSGAEDNMVLDDGSYEFASHMVTSAYTPIVQQFTPLAYPYHFQWVCIALTTENPTASLVYDVVFLAN